MTVTEAIRARRSIRKYKPDPVPPEHVRLLLEAAMMAPSRFLTLPVAISIFIFAIQSAHRWRWVWWPSIITGMV